MNRPPLIDGAAFVHLVKDAVDYVAKWSLYGAAYRDAPTGQYSDAHVR